MSPERPEALQVALQVIEIFETLGVDYHLGGSYASSIHGVPRQTQDLDLVADLGASQASAFIELLGTEFYADVESARLAIGRQGASTSSIWEVA